MGFKAKYTMRTKLVIVSHKTSFYLKSFWLFMFQASYLFEYLFEWQVGIQRHRYGTCLNPHLPTNTGRMLKQSSNLLQNH